MKKEKQISKKLKMKIALCIILILVFIADVIYVGYFRNSRDASGELETEKESQKIVCDFDKFEKYFSEKEKENLYVALEKLSDISTNEKVKIFYATVPQTDDTEYWFFASAESSEAPIFIVLNYKTYEVDVSWSLYTEEEILSEVWKGNAPDVRDYPQT